MNRDEEGDTCALEFEFMCDVDTCSSPRAVQRIAIPDAVIELHADVEDFWQFVDEANETLVPFDDSSGEDLILLEIACDEDDCVRSLYAPSDLTIRVMEVGYEKKGGLFLSCSVCHDEQLLFFQSAI